MAERRSLTVAEWHGVRSDLAPRLIAPGELSDARNVRAGDGALATREGFSVNMPLTAAVMAAPLLLWPGCRQTLDRANQALGHSATGCPVTAVENVLAQGLLERQLAAGLSTGLVDPQTEYTLAEFQAFAEALAPHYVKGTYAGAAAGPELHEPGDVSDAVSVQALWDEVRTWTVTKHVPASDSTSDTVDYQSYPQPGPAETAEEAFSAAMDAVSARANDPLTALAFSMSGPRYGWTCTVIWGELDVNWWGKSGLNLWTGRGRSMEMWRSTAAHAVYPPAIWKFGWDIDGPLAPGSYWKMAACDVNALGRPQWVSPCDPQTAQFELASPTWAYKGFWAESMGTPTCIVLATWEFVHR